jgi:hypothetical protein
MDDIEGFLYCLCDLWSSAMHKMVKLLQGNYVTTFEPFKEDYTVFISWMVTPLITSVQGCDGSGGGKIDRAWCRKSFSTLVL